MIRTEQARTHILRSLALLLLLSFAGSAALGDGETAPARDPKQPVDDAYTAKIKKYTTQPFFTSPLVDYLPASKNVPTPEAVLGDVAGAPGILPYAEVSFGQWRPDTELVPWLRSDIETAGQLTNPARVALGLSQRQIARDGD